MPFGVEKFSHGYEGGRGSARRRAAAREAERNPPRTSRRAAAKQAEGATVATVSPSGTVTAGPAAPSPAAAVRSTKASRRRAGRARRAAHRQERRRRAAVLASVAANRRRRARSRESGRPASVARISSRSRRDAKSSRPAEYQGRKTAGTPTKTELDRAAEADLLKVNKAGYLTTPAIRQASRAVKRAEKAVRRSSAPLPGLDPEQTRVARKVLRVGRRGNRPRKDLLSAAETGLVESGFRNLPAGDADSEGWRQERTSIFGTGPRGPRNVRASARRFYDELEHVGTAGRNAQTAQGSAFPARYDEKRPEAAAIVAAFERGDPKARHDLAKATREARSLGLHPKTAAQREVGRPSKKLVKRTVVAEHAMREIEGTPYVWGGGHASFTAAGGLDCSGAVSYVLHKVEPHKVKAPLVSGAMGSVLEPGPGALTVFYNDKHTFLRLINRKGEAEYWGTSVGDSGAGGLTRHPTPSKSYLAQYNVGHVPGMGRRQALQLGADPAAVSGGTDYAGMTFGSSGTTATIDPGAGTTKTGKPGRSKRPIRLTTAQRFDRNKRKLRRIGAPLRTSSRSSGRSESHPILEELRAKYGSNPTSAKEAAAT